ncbi:MAG TPA: YciI family protein [Puia sp.]|nr:YciI family protein [Puia sp.]
MNEFLLLFRRDFSSTDAQPSPQELQNAMKMWQNWLGGIAAQNKLVDRGNRLASEGKVIHAGDRITDGPYAEIKEALGGYTIVRADSLEEAAELAKGCPVTLIGGNVEVRQIVPPNL